MAPALLDPPHSTILSPTAQVAPPLHTWLSHGSVLETVTRHQSTRSQIAIDSESRSNHSKKNLCRPTVTGRPTSRCSDPTVLREVRHLSSHAPEYNLYDPPTRYARHASPLVKHLRRVSERVSSSHPLLTSRYRLSDRGPSSNDAIIVNSSGLVSTRTFTDSLLILGLLLSNIRRRQGRYVVWVGHTHNNTR